MKLGYYNPQLKTRQIKQNGKVVGYMLLTHRAYGYNVQLHYFDRAGYEIDKYFPTPEKAELYCEKGFAEVNK